MTRSAEVCGIVAFSWHSLPLQDFTVFSSNIRLINKSPCTIFNSLVHEPGAKHRFPPPALESLGWFGRVQIFVCFTKLAASPPVKAYQPGKSRNARFRGFFSGRERPRPISWLLRKNLQRKTKNQAATRGGHGASFLAWFQSSAGLFHFKQRSGAAPRSAAQRRAKPSPFGSAARRGGHRKRGRFRNNFAVIPAGLVQARSWQAAVRARALRGAARELRGAARWGRPAATNHRLKTREGNLVALNDLRGVALTQICLR